MPLWEYCEVAYTPKQVFVHVYSSREGGTYEGVQKPEDWGTLLAQLGADGWEMVGVMSAKAANHTLYYFKRAIDSSAKAEWEEKERKAGLIKWAELDATKPPHTKEDFLKQADALKKRSPT